MRLFVSCWWWWYWWSVFLFGLLSIAKFKSSVFCSLHNKSKADQVSPCRRLSCMWFRASQCFEPFHTSLHCVWYFVREGFVVISNGRLECPSVMEKTPLCRHVVVLSMCAIPSRSQDTDTFESVELTATMDRLHVIYIMVCLPLHIKR